MYSILHDIYDEINGIHDSDSYIRVGDVLVGTAGTAGTAGTGGTGGAVETLLLPLCDRERTLLLAHTSVRVKYAIGRQGAYSSKWVPRLGLLRRLSSVLRTFASGRTTMTGTGEWERQYFDSPLIADAPNLEDMVWIIPRGPRALTMTESGR